MSWHDNILVFLNLINKISLKGKPKGLQQMRSWELVNNTTSAFYPHLLHKIHQRSAYMALRLTNAALLRAPRGVSGITRRDCEWELDDPLSSPSAPDGSNVVVVVVVQLNSAQGWSSEVLNRSLQLMHPVIITVVVAMLSWMPSLISVMDLLMSLLGGHVKAVRGLLRRSRGESRAPRVMTRCFLVA